MNDLKDFLLPINFLTANISEIFKAFIYFFTLIGRDLIEKNSPLAYSNMNILLYIFPIVIYEANTELIFTLNMFEFICKACFMLQCVARQLITAPNQNK